MQHPHTICRACRHKDLVPILDLGLQPLANAFSKIPNEPVELYPLKLMACPECTLLQLSIVIDPDILYRNYNYVTSQSLTLQDHLVRLFRDIHRHQTGSVIELGSNDGYVLKKLQQDGFGPVLGIDPAENLCEIATQEGLTVVCGPFNSETATRAWSLMQPANIVLCRHAFCHVDNWTDFLRDLHLITHDESIVVLEVPNTAETIMRNEFDQIYHEHLSYLCVDSLRKALENTGWHLHEYYAYPIHGGAVAFILRKDESDIEPIALRGVYEPGFLDTDELRPYRQFAERCQENIALMKELVTGLRRRGKSIAAFGASAKSTVWINACGFTQADIACIYDNTPQKIGKFSPGTDIPILDERGLFESPHLSDYIIVFCWNYWDEVVKRFNGYLNSGGQLIRPIPEIRLFGRNDFNYGEAQEHTTTAG